MTDTSDEYKRFILELIDVYGSLPALWDITCKDYSNRALKEQKYDILLKKFREKHPNGDKIQLKKKINGLRTNYRRELKRLRDQEKNGESIETPNLYYFEAFHDILKKIEGVSYKNVNFLYNFNKICLFYYLKIDAEDLENSQTISSVKKPKPVPVANPSITLDSNEDEDLVHIPKKKKHSHNKIENIIKVPTEPLKSPKNSQQLLAAVWSDKLSHMKRTQRIVAEKLINDIMFNGELGLLNFNTSLTNLKKPSSCDNDFVMENSIEYDTDSGDIEEEFKIEFVQD